MRHWAAAHIAAWLVLLVLSGAPADETASYTIDVGIKTLQVSYRPIIADNGQNYIAFDLLANVESYRETRTEPAIKLGPQLGESEAGGEAIKVQRPALSEATVREFKIGDASYFLAEAVDGSLRVSDSNVGSIGSGAIIQGKRMYIAEDSLFAMGIALSYAPETGNMRLLGILTSISGNKSEQTLNITTLLPSRAAISGVEGGFKVVLEAVFVKESYERQILGSSVSVRNLPYHRLEISCRQETITGYKLYTDEKSQTELSVHLANHFNVVSTERTSSGEIALTVGFTRPVEVKTQVLQSPPRLVLDFASAIYREATKYIDVKVGGVRQIRVGQFSQDPPVVRVVVEMSRLLDYRILKQGSGEKYYVQMLSARLGKAAIMLDAGHGGSDTGAIGVTGLYEKDIVLLTTQQLQRKLGNMGYEIVLTRNNDSFVSLGERADYANSALPMIFVSIHANAIENPQFTGVMTFHYKGSNEGVKLASAIQRALLSSTGAVDRGVRTANFFVLRETVVPAVLVEIGFLTNSIEEYKLRDPHYQQRIVSGLAAGIDEYMRTFGGG